jgi:hypothetical protein
MRDTMKASQEKVRHKELRAPINAQKRENEACNGHHPIHPVEFEETISKWVKSILACQPENSKALQRNWQPDTRDKDADRSYAA